MTTSTHSHKAWTDKGGHVSKIETSEEKRVPKNLLTIMQQPS
jgi:hypothetical protein